MKAFSASRRSFLKAAASLTAGAALLPSSAGLNGLTSEAREPPPDHSRADYTISDPGVCGRNRTQENRLGHNLQRAISGAR